MVDFAQDAIEDDEEERQLLIKNLLKESSKILATSKQTKTI
jgi:hypothetical protein